MRLFIVATSCLALAAPAALSAQDSASYVIRLGRDTIGLERSVRTGSQIRGEYVMRAPRPVHALYTFDLNPDGTIRRYELISHNIAGGPGPAETRSVVEIAGDSATITIPRGDSSVTQRVAAGPGTALWMGYGVAGFELFARQARPTPGTPNSFPMVTAGTLRGTAQVTRTAGDTLVAGITLAIGQITPIKMTLGRGGRLQWLSAVGTPLQIVAERVPSVDIAAAGPAFASRPLGTLSPRDTVQGAVGEAELWVEYGRPSRRGRDIFGQVVPWNVVWRTGANAATHFRTPVDLVIGGAAVPAGTYTLWTLPSSTGWKLIINKQTGQWGTDYHADQDLARVDMQVETLAQPVEQMTIDITPAGAGATLSISWDRTRASALITKR